MFEFEVKHGSNRRLKLLMIVIVLALLAITVWYYLNSGGNPIPEMRNKTSSLERKPQFDTKEDLLDNENLQGTVGNTLSKEKTFHDESNAESVTEKATTALDERAMDSSGNDVYDSSSLNAQDAQPVVTDTVKSLLPEEITGEKLSDQEKGKVETAETRLDVEILNTLRSTDTIYYNEGILENAGSTFYREARPRYLSNENAAVLFLHDKRFNSAIWINIGTFQILAELGYRAIAVDLPGHGNSSTVSIPSSRDEILVYMGALFTSLNLDMPVLVAPSKSGEYALPLVMTNSLILRGLVVIAPIDTSHYFITDYEKLTVPLLVMFGERDDLMAIESSLDNLFYVPDRKVYMIRHATRACYADHPPTFHKLLLNFLRKIKG